MLVLFNSKRTESFIKRVWLLPLMSYLEFEAKGIEYRLILTTHGTVRKEPIDDLDAIVFETGRVPPNRFEAALKLGIMPELQNYMDTITEKPIPIYSVEIAARWNYPILYNPTVISHLLSRSFPSAALYGLCSALSQNVPSLYTFLVGGMALQLWLPLILTLDNNKITKIAGKINSCLSFISQSPIEELRNASCARKTKKGVVPKLLKDNPKKFQKKSPRIGLIYGAAHSGIKECLLSDLRTAITLNLNRVYGIPLFFRKKELNDIYEYRVGQPKGCSGDIWGRFPYEVKTHKFECPLFS